MTRPVRIQLSRAKGWRLPAGAIKCDRATRRGNPWTPGEQGLYRLRPGEAPLLFGRALSVEEAVALHRLWLLGAFGEAGGGFVRDDRFGLLQVPHGHAAAVADLALIRGCDLACWCPPQRPGAAIVHCHADTLLVLANAGDDGGWAASRAGWRAAVPLRSPHEAARAA